MKSSFIRELEREYNEDQLKYELESPFEEEVQEDIITEEHKTCCIKEYYVICTSALIGWGILIGAVYYCTNL